MTLTTRLTAVVQRLTDAVNFREALFRPFGLLAEGFILSLMAFVFLYWLFATSMSLYYAFTRGSFQALFLGLVYLFGFGNLLFLYLKDHRSIRYGDSVQ